MQQEEINVDTHIVVQYQAKDSRQVSVVLDGKEIFNELVTPPLQMPPLVFSKNISEAGAHTLVVTEAARATPLECKFTTPDVATILITIREKSEEDDIDTYTEKVRFE